MGFGIKTSRKEKDERDFVQMAPPGTSADFKVCLHKYTNTQNTQTSRFSTK